MDGMHGDGEDLRMHPKMDASKTVIIGGMHTRESLVRSVVVCTRSWGCMRGDACTGEGSESIYLAGGKVCIQMDASQKNANSFQYRGREGMHTGACILAGTPAVSTIAGGKGCIREHASRRAPRRQFRL
jgi:hypothetical protein